MNRTLLLIPFLTLLLAACTPATAYPNDGYPSADQPVASDDAAAPGQPSYLPQPSDSSLVRAEAFLASSDLLTLESSPLQFSLTLKGSLPTPCHQLRVDVGQPDAQNKVNVDVYAVAKPDRVCAQVLQPFEVNVPLGSFAAGHYFLLVNGTQAAEFDS